MTTGLTKEEKSQTLDSFFFSDETELTVIDRSTLELYATCPAQARLVETGAVRSVSRIASVGEEVHKALGAAIYEYVSSAGALSSSDLANEARSYISGARPDVQPAAIAAMKASVWEWSKYVGSISPNNILRWDGGEGPRSGQLSWDMEDLGIRVTSEVDLLHASPSKELLVEVDYKCGHKVYTASDVADRFQFAVHAWLVFHNYPDVNGLLVRVWNTRVNRMTYGVEFRREKLPDIAAQIRSAALHWKQWHQKAINDPSLPTWPDIEKCSMCDGAALCPAANRDIADAVDNESAFVDQMVATEAALDKMHKIAKDRVKKLGRDLEGTGHNRFGTRKPSSRAPMAALYQITTKSNEESEES